MFIFSVQSVWNNSKAVLQLARGIFACHKTLLIYCIYWSMTGENLWIKAFWDSAGNYLRKHSTGNDLKKHICSEIGRHTLHGMIFPHNINDLSGPKQKIFFLYLFALHFQTYFDSLWHPQNFLSELLANVCISIISHWSLYIFQIIIFTVLIFLGFFSVRNIEKERLLLVFFPGNYFKIFLHWNEDSRNSGIILLRFSASLKAVQLY